MIGTTSTGVHSTWNNGAAWPIPIDGRIEKIHQWYSGKVTKSRFITGAYEATDFFPKIRGGTWLHFTAAPIKDLNGVMIGVVETLEDITERKRAEDALRESEIRFREQHQNNPLAIFTWQHRAGDFVLVGFNKAAETLTNGRERTTSENSLPISIHPGRKLYPKSGNVFLNGPLSQRNLYQNISCLENL